MQTSLPPRQQYLHGAPSHRVAVVVLNYCTPELALEAARSAAEDLDVDRDVVLIVDNDSPDGSADIIERGLVERALAGVRLIRSDTNGGFAAGNNVGIRAVSAEIYWLLNSDTIVQPGASAAMLAALDSADDIGLASPLLCWEDGQPQISAFRFASPLSEVIRATQTGLVRRLLEAWDVPLGVQTERTIVPWTSFASVMIKRRVLEVVGLLDEGYFMYFEDADYCRSAKRAGFRVVHEPAGRVVHLRGKSSPVKEATRLRKPRPRYYYAARNRYFRRGFGPFGALLANLTWTLGLGVALPREAFGSNKSARVQGEFLDNWRGSLPDDEAEGS
jgi:N-acetylglucosaminyl-diphospho-decaprenol L-rhamnosyltransferase